MNLSERLAKAAMERRRQPEADAPRGHVTPIDSHPSSALLPERSPDPVDSGRIAVMKMRLPEPTSPDTTSASDTGLPLWQRPFIDVMRDAGLATVTSLPIHPRDDDTTDDDLDNAELAKTIPMPGLWMPKSTADADHDKFHMPPLAAAESEGLASGSLRSEHDGHSTDRAHNYLSDQIAMINLDDVAVDAEIILDGPSADVLLDRWSHNVTADEQDRQERLDGLYRRMADAAKQPRVTFGPIDLRDQVVAPAEDPAPLFRVERPAEVVLRRVDDEHLCPQCGAAARVDIHDPMRGRIHLSCDSCYKMWQERVESTVQSDQPFMRD